MNYPCNYHNYVCHTAFILYELKSDHMRNDIQTFAARALDEEIDQVEKCDVSVMFVGLNPVINDRLQKRRAEILQRSKSARLHSDTSVCIFSSQHSNPSRSHKPT